MVSVAFLESCKPKYLQAKISLADLVPVLCRNPCWVSLPFLPSGLEMIGRPTQKACLATGERAQRMPFITYLQILWLIKEMDSSKRHIDSFCLQRWIMPRGWLKTRKHRMYLSHEFCHFTYKVQLMKLLLAASPQYSCLE